MWKLFANAFLLLRLFAIIFYACLVCFAAQQYNSLIYLFYPNGQFNLLPLVAVAVHASNGIRSKHYTYFYVDICEHFAYKSFHTYLRKQAHVKSMQILWMPPMETSYVRTTCWISLKQQTKHFNIHCLVRERLTENWSAN